MSQDQREYHWDIVKQQYNLSSDNINLVKMKTEEKLLSQNQNTSQISPDVEKQHSNPLSPQQPYPNYSSQQALPGQQPYPNYSSPHAYPNYYYQQTLPGQQPYPNYYYQQYPNYYYQQGQQPYPNYYFQQAVPGQQPNPSPQQAVPGQQPDPNYSSQQGLLKQQQYPNYSSQQALPGQQQPSPNYSSQQTPPEQQQNAYPYPPPNYYSPQQGIQYQSQVSYVSSERNGFSTNWKPSHFSNWIDSEGVPRYSIAKNFLTSCPWYNETEVNTKVQNLRTKLNNDQYLDSGQKKLINRYLDREYRSFNCNILTMLMIVGWVFPIVAIIALLIMIFYLIGWSIYTCVWYGVNSSMEEEYTEERRVALGEGVNIEITTSN
jgi:hypothetical protein